MSGYDLLYCEMPLPAAGLGPTSLFFTRAFDGVWSNVCRITADGSLFGPFEEVPASATMPDTLQQCPAAKYPAEGQPLDWNGDIEFWSEQRPRQVFFACFVDGLCVRILPKNEYLALMERGRRWALLPPSM